MLPVPVWASIPFVMFLLCIALLPLISHRWWGKYYPAVSIPLGIVTAALFVFLFNGGEKLLHTALEYISFISLLGSLFVVTGGILIRIEGQANPILNAALLFFGAIIANILGTTGASMLLVRPFLHLNRERLKGYLVIFFIFTVSNIGGLLTPIGDPPLFLGYLKGVPFFWIVGKVWHIWFFALALVIGIFLAMDYHHHRGVKPFEQAASKSRITLKGWYNFIFLGIIIFAVFKPTPWREIMMLASAAASYFLTPRRIHKEHHFKFAPINEVAILFFGIFATMVPTLVWLEANAHGMLLTSPGAFYWASGSLSSFLDNAPTYLSFLSAAIGFTGLDVAGILVSAPKFIVAISVGAVFFGANTYIGNGPNFMVKSIAEHAHVSCPTFFGYIFRYSIPILLPVYFLVWLFFIR